MDSGKKADNTLDAVEQEKLGYRSMQSGGRCDWKQLREAVGEATGGRRGHAGPFDPSYYPGHQMVEGINYNSLDRIVTAFVDADRLTHQPDRAAVEALRAPLLGFVDDLTDCGRNSPMCLSINHDQLKARIAQARQALANLERTK